LEKDGKNLYPPLSERGGNAIVKIKVFLYKKIL